MLCLPLNKCYNVIGEEIDIIALGTNSLATSLMLKAGANEGATGENAIVYNGGTRRYLFTSSGNILDW